MYVRLPLADDEKADFKIQEFVWRRVQESICDVKSMSIHYQEKSQSPSPMEMTLAIVKTAAMINQHFMHIELPNASFSKANTPWSHKTTRPPSSPRIHICSFRHQAISLNTTYNTLRPLNSTRSALSIFQPTISDVSTVIWKHYWLYDHTFSYPQNYVRY